MIGIPVKSRGSNPEIDERFGRGPLFCIIDKDKNLTFIENSAKDLASGAGGKAVCLLADQSVTKIIAPHVGPKAMDALNGLDIKVYNMGSSITVNDALKSFENNLLEEVSNQKKGLRRV